MELCGKMNLKDCGESEGKAFGYHLMLDCYECDPEIIADIDMCYRYLDRLVDLVGVTKQSQPYVFRTPDGFRGKEGLSGWVPLVESGISIHTLTGTGFVSIDVYCCRRFNQRVVVDFTADYFKTDKIEKHHILRGTDYYKYTDQGMGAE